MRKVYKTINEIYKTINVRQSLRGLVNFFCCMTAEEGRKACLSSWLFVLLSYVMHDTGFSPPYIKSRLKENICKYKAPESVISRSFVKTQHKFTPRWRFNVCVSSTDEFTLVTWKLSLWILQQQKKKKVYLSKYIVVSYKKVKFHNLTSPLFQLQWSSLCWESIVIIRLYNTRIQTENQRGWVKLHYTQLCWKCRDWWKYHTECFGFFTNSIHQNVQPFKHTTYFKTSTVIVGLIVL